MNYSIEKYISDLLYNNDCIIIMNFGGFVCNHISAQLEEETGILSPPNKTILFNSQLKENDGLLINHISSHEKISLEKAKNEVLKFVDQCNSNLKKFRSLRFEKIGLFTLSDEGKILFTQDSNVNYNINSYGFQDLINNKITRDHSKVIEESLKIIKTKNRLTPKRMLKAAAVLIPLLGISLLSITQEKNINKVYNQIAELNPLSFFETKAEEKVERIITVKEIKKEIEKPILSIPAEVITEKKFYIIAGAFGVEENANKLKARLNSWNYNSTIIKNNNIMRVSYNEFTTKEDAILSLAKIRKENPQAWILTI